jgi:hypothetical protein
VRAARRSVLAIVTLAGGFALAAGCHRSAMPPRPDGAAVVVAPETVDDGIATTPEVEPNDTLAKAQPLAVTPTTPVAIAGTLPAGEHDVDVYRIDFPAPDAGPSPAPAGDAAVPIPPPRLVLRADLRPAANSNLAVTLEALDASGHPLCTAVGEPGDAIAIPNLAVRPGTIHLRVRLTGSEGAGGGAYRLVVRENPFDAGAEIEPNGDAAHATELAPGGEAVGYLGWRHDQDWYRLPLGGVAEGSVLSVDLDPVAEVGASLQLYDDGGHKLTEARGRKGERVVLRNVRFPSGAPAAFVVVRAEVGWSAEARYNIRPRADLPKAGTEAEPNDDQAHAQTIGDGTVTGYLARGDVDFFRYSTDAMALLDLEVDPPERGGVEVEVTREDNTLLARAQSGHHQPARIAGQPIPGGPILIRVVPRHGPIDPDDPYRLTVSSRPTPAAGQAAPKAE